MPSPIRIALLGYGRVARDHLRALFGLDTIRVAAMVDPDEDARDTAARDAASAHHRVRVFADVDEMLDDDDAAVDAALVTTPPSTHAELTERLTGAGRHVLCEKPFATSVADAERMLAAAERSGRTLMMASKFRFVEDVRAARRLIDDGTIGRPVFYRNVFCSLTPMRSRWNADRARSGGGVLFDNGTHAVELARFLVGPVARVSAAIPPTSQPLEVEDSALIMFETSRVPAVGVVELSWSVDDFGEDFVELQGTEGTLGIGWRRSRCRLHGDDGWTTFGTGFDKLAALRAQLDHFAAVVRGHAAPSVTPEDAIESVRFIEAAYRSAELGTWISTAEAAAR